MRKPLKKTLDMSIATDMIVSMENPENIASKNETEAEKKQRLITAKDISILSPEEKILRRIYLAQQEAEKAQKKLRDLRKEKAAERKRVRDHRLILLGVAQEKEWQEQGVALSEKLKNLSKYFSRDYDQEAWSEWVKELERPENE